MSRYARPGDAIFSRAFSLLSIQATLYDDSTVSGVLSTQVHDFADVDPSINLDTATFLNRYLADYRLDVPTAELGTAVDNSILRIGDDRYVIVAITHNPPEGFSYLHLNKTT